MAKKSNWEKVEGIERGYHLNGVLLASKSELADILDLTIKTITNYTAKGMEKHELSTRTFSIYDVVYCKEWIKVNINNIKSTNAKVTIKRRQEESSDKDNEKDSPVDDYEKMTTPQKRQYLKSLDKNTLDEMNVAETILERENKNKEKDDGWVRADKPSKTIKAMARGFISLMKNLMINISKDGANNTQDELYHKIDRYLSKEMAKLTKELNNE